MMMAASKYAPASILINVYYADENHIARDANRASCVPVNYFRLLVYALFHADATRQACRDSGIV
jgi:hypothetical protein